MLFIMEHALARNLRKLIADPLVSPWLPEEPDAFARKMCDELQISPPPRNCRRWRNACAAAC